MRRLLGGMVAFTAFALTVAACGDDDDDAGTATPTPTEAVEATDAPSPTEAVTPTEPAGTTAESAATTPGTEAPAAGNDFPDEIFGDLDGEVVWYDTTGGTTTEYRENTIFANFTEATGVTTRGDFQAGQTKFFATYEAGADVPWSMIEFGSKAEFNRAVEQGLVMPLDTDIVPVDRMQDGAYTEYGIEVLRYGWNVVYNTDVYPDPATAPSTVADLFDTEKFPGKRCLFQWPGGTLEFALMADGVAPDDLYPLDVDRGFAKLDTVKDDTVWWLTGDESIRYLVDGECDLGMSWSSRVYNAVTKDGHPLAMTWNDSMVSYVYYGVPVGAPNPEAGMALISWWIRDLEGQREFVDLAPLPTPIKALDEEGYPDDLSPWLASGDNVEDSVKEGVEFWQENLDPILERFNTWVAT
jgi:putative spermidine/putrescine transport system substrate-binding protein